jgi:hypothetical protein
MKSMTAKELKTVRPDAKGRITLGHLAHGVSSYSVTQDRHNRIILEPRVEIPANEKWLFDNKAAMKQVKQGLEDSAAGRVKNKGSFSKYKDDEDTE